MNKKFHGTNIGYVVMLSLPIFYNICMCIYLHSKIGLSGPKLGYFVKKRIISAFLNL